MKTIGIIGGAGYVAGELIRLLLGHPEVQLGFVQSDSQVGKHVASVHSDLIGDCELVFTAALDQPADVVFICKGHGQSRPILEADSIAPDAVIIDLSQDFRRGKDPFGFVYGLPELFRDKIRQSRFIANPGCFATAIQLAVLPLAGKKILKSSLHVNAITGSTGAGGKLTETTHFSWRNNNVSVYKPFVHQHLAEITQGIKTLDSEFDHDVFFIPVRGNFTRGILASAYTDADEEIDHYYEIYREFYEDHPFVWVSRNNIHLKQVVNTNKCLLHLIREGDKLLIISIIDNLIKGAAGQAIQNMNLSLGLKETAGLKIKALVH